MSDIIRSSLEGVKGFTDMQTVIGSAIHTPSGVTVIPVSKVSVGFAGGGVDFGIKKLVGAQNFGSGSGSGVSITPIAFLTVNKNADVKLIPIDPDAGKGVERITSLIEHTPEIIEKIRDTFSES
jgi:sporulation protein YtfJ